MAAVSSLNSPLEECQSLKLANPSGGIVAGTVINESSYWGFALATSPDNASVPSTGVTVNRLSEFDFFTYIYRAPRVTVVKDTNASVATGEVAYWDPTTDQVGNSASTGRVAIGYWQEDVGTGITSGQIEWVGDLQYTSGVQWVPT